MNHYVVKRARNGQALLNLACGTHTNWEWTNMDFSPYAILAHHRRLARLLRMIGLLSQERLQKVQDIDPQIIRHDLRKGIPFQNETFDAVYHSHFLEHIPRQAAPVFLRQCYDVLKHGGIARVVVPDLERIVTGYSEGASRLTRGDEQAWALYDKALLELFGQFLPQECGGTSLQRPVVRRLERWIRGDTHRAGEMHRWMYDRFSLDRLLRQAGFCNVRVESPSTSGIRDWQSYHLDVCQDGSVYKPGSLYVEGVK